MSETEAGTSFSDEHILAHDIEPNLAVEIALEEAIEAKGKITFAEFTELCLFSPEGYYATAAGRFGGLGAQGDFITSPGVSPVFGATLANALHDMWQSMGRPDPFHIVEMGAGEGVLARDISNKMRDGYPDMVAATRYMTIEKSPSLAVRQRSLLQKYSSHSVVMAEATALPLRDIEGVFLSNELPDDFPVHRLIKRGGVIKEIYVGMDDERHFVDVEDDVSSEAQAIAFPADVPDGVEVTVSPDIEKWQQTMAQALRRGYVLTVDYGVKDVAKKPDAYQPRVYSGHFKTHTGHSIALAYRYPGSVNITTSVNFRHLRHMGEAAGLRTVRQTDQATYIQEHGYEAELDALLRRDIALQNSERPVDRRFAARYLITNGWMGHFVTLVQAKGV